MLIITDILTQNKAFHLITVNNIILKYVYLVYRLHVNKFFVLFRNVVIKFSALVNTRVAGIYYILSQCLLYCIILLMQ